jgi:hypothetical protein
MAKFLDRPAVSSPGSELIPRFGDVAASPTPSDTPDLRITHSRSSADAVIMTASWSCSVGSTWTVVLRTPKLTIQPSPTMWISSGVPITEPAPESLARRLLAEHGFLLFADADNPERARSVCKLGFVSRDAELILLAEVIRDKYIGYPEHPLALASRWTAAGVSAKTALGWLRSGTSPGGCPQIDQRPPAHS